MLCLLLLCAAWPAPGAEQLLEGEFGQLNLGRPLVAGTHIPTIRELREIVSRRGQKRWC